MSREADRRDAAERRARLTRRIRKIFLASCGLAWFAWWLGRSAHDAPWPVDLLSYVPAAPIALAMLVAAILVSGRGRLAVLLAAAIVGAAVTDDMRFASMEAESELKETDAAATQYRLVHWNTFRDHLSWQKKIDFLRELEADVYILNELPRHVSRGETALRFGPGFTYAFGELNVIGCRGTIANRRFTTVGQASLLSADCRTDDDHVLRLLAVDMPASPLEARRPLLEKVYAAIDEQQPDLVAGDFNTPRRAGMLRLPPSGYRHAYEVVGSGWPYTWPVPVPFLAIDQCLVGPRIRPVEFRYVSTPWSDHRLQVLELTLSLPL